ncbi:MAG: DNA/RNA nuclease SfsA, partial [Firmicutes bacterium]|nr:DNA/RNA nuclease SfsA [Bacillota bacterium]
TEVKYGSERSRIDVLAEDAQGRLIYVEVKNTTLKVGSHACFPDAVSERGTKHLRELQGMVREGHRAAIAFFVHRDDVTAFDAARHIDPAYAAELDQAAEVGVQILPLKVHLAPCEYSASTWAMEWTLQGLWPWERR